MTSFSPAANAGCPHFVFAIVMLPIGLFLTGGGAWLIGLGDSRGSLARLAAGGLDRHADELRFAKAATSSSWSRPVAPWEPANRATT